MSVNIRMLEYSDEFALHKLVQSVLIRDSEANLNPLVSIMIPTYMRPALLRESIMSALAQSTPFPFEVVVVDNTDDHEMVVEIDKMIASFDAPNLRFYRNESNLGMFGNWNRCIELARGRWFTILNDDDLLDATFLAESLKVVLRSGSIRMVGCKTKTLDERVNTKQTTVLGGVRLLVKYVIGRLYKPKLCRLDVSDYFLSNRHHGTLGVLMERNAAVSLGGFASKYYPSSDFIFFVRFALSNSVCFLPKSLATCRIGVNESLNSNLCVGWLQQGLQLREEMLPYLRANLKLLRHYSYLTAVNSAYSYRDLWNPVFNVRQTLSNEGLITRPAWLVLIMLLITRSLLFFIFMLSHKKKSNL